MTFDEFVKAEQEFDAKLKTLLPPMPDTFHPYIRIVGTHKKSDLTFILMPEMLEKPAYLAGLIETLKEALWQGTEQDTEAASKLYDQRHKMNMEYFG